MGKRDSNKKRTITPAQKWGLGLGDLGYSLIANTLASYILFFGNTVMGVLVLSWVLQFQ